MPKRSTTTFTRREAASCSLATARAHARPCSEDAPAGKETPLHVYYCKYSGEHLLITGKRAVLSAGRRRNSDARVAAQTPS